MKPERYLIILLIIGWFVIAVIHSLQITKLKQFDTESLKRDIEHMKYMLDRTQQNKKVYW